MFLLALGICVYSMNFGSAMLEMVCLGLGGRDAGERVISLFLQKLMSWAQYVILSLFPLTPPGAHLILCLHMLDSLDAWRDFTSLFALAD